MKPPSPKHKQLSVGQVADRAGVAISTLHFYERLTLISSTRNARNQRIYPRHVLRRVAFIRTSQRVGIPLAKIKEALSALPEGQTPDRHDWEKLSRQWREDLDHRITQLQRLRDDLTGCIGCGCLSIDRCALYNPRDELATAGSIGPILLSEPDL